MNAGNEQVDMSGVQIGNTTLHNIGTPRSVPGGIPYNDPKQEAQRQKNRAKKAEQKERRRQAKAAEGPR